MGIAIRLPDPFPVPHECHTAASKTLQGRVRRKDEKVGRELIASQTHQDLDSNPITQDTDQ